MLDFNILSTYAKHMICPETLAENQSGAISEYGQEGFNNYHFRHSSKSYHGKSNEKELLNKLIESLGSCLESTQKPVLLLSDGKDSMSIAIALSKMGVQCDTLTLLRADDEEMKSYIEEVCTLLGHTSHFVTVEKILGAFDKSDFLASCELMDHPVLDQGFLFFLLALKVFFIETNFDPKHCQFIDGLGNDEHLGYLPSKMQHYSYKLSKLGLWKLKPSWFTELNWYLRSPAESHGDLSALSCFFKFESALDLNKYFSMAEKGSDFVDFRAFSRGSFHDHQCMMEKTRVASEYYGSSIIFPWKEPNLADFCFNLPLESKYDFTRQLNKLPLRKLLADEIAWKQEKRGVDLYYDLKLDYFNEAICKGIVPDFAIKKITDNVFLNDNVKKRALLELLNLAGYMRSHGYDDCVINKLLEVR